MVELKLQRMGRSVGVVLPKAVRERLGVGVGDRILLVETESGWRLTPYDPEFERQMRAAEQVAKAHRRALEDLAR